MNLEVDYLQMPSENLAFHVMPPVHLATVRPSVAVSNVTSSGIANPVPVR